MVEQNFRGGEISPPLLIERLKMYNCISSFMYLVLYLLLICLVGVIIYGVKKYGNEKRAGCIFVTSIVSLFLLFLINQLAVINLYFSALSSFSQCDYKKSTIYFDIAAKLAVFRAQKTTLYGQLGETCMATGDGKRAMEYFEKAYRINGSYAISPGGYAGNLWPISAGMLYAYTGEYDKVYQITGDTRIYQLSIIAAIYQKDYAKALGYANLAMIKAKHSPNLFAQRAYIYKKLNKPQLAREDLQRAVLCCKNDKECIKLRYKQFEDDYWTAFRVKQLKKYGFDKK